MSTIPDDLLEIERVAAAEAYASDGEATYPEPADRKLAHDIARLVGELTFDDDCRHLSVWLIDDCYVVVAANAQGEQDPDISTVVLP